MKKYFVVLFLAFLVIPLITKASVLYSQTITLTPGWNTVSTPKVLESHTFSVAETSNNFDIYALDSSKPSGWATLADLNQTQFTPLFGYFINNKTGTNQTLTFNYKNVSVGEQFFSRIFSSFGWNSFGIANPTYAKNYNSDNTDTNNPDHILNSLISASVHYGDVVDFTDANYGTNKNSVAVANPWKDAVRSPDIANNTEINTLNDFRETKGYAIYIKDVNTEYSGLQNTTIPQCSDGIDNDGDGSIDMVDVGCDNNIDNTEYNVPTKLTISKDASCPMAQNVKVSDTGSTIVPMLVFKLKTEGSAMTFDSINFDITSTVSPLAMVSELTLKANGSTIATWIPTTATLNQTVVFNLDTTETLPADSTTVFTVEAKINDIDNFSQGGSLRISFSDISAEDTLTNIVTEIGSAVGETQAFFANGIVASAFTYGTPVVTTNTSGTTTSATYAISFKVSASGASYYVKKNAGLTANNGGATVSFADLSASGATLDGSSWLVSDGDTATFTTTGVIDGSAVTNAFAKIQLYQLNYGTTNTGTGSLYTFSPSTSFETSSTYFTD